MRIMKTIFDYLHDLRAHVTQMDDPVTATLILVGIVLVGSVLAWFVTWLIYRCIRKHLLPKDFCEANSDSSFRCILLTSKLIPYLLQVVPLVMSGVLSSTLVPEGGLRVFMLRLVQVYFSLVCANVFAAVMRVTYRFTNLRRGVKASPQKGIFQVLILLGYLFAAVSMIATLSGRDATVILSGMTALSAVLMLVFRDAILGLTAGITLSSNGLVKIGDWIEVASAGADGTVEDIAMTSVRVRNWDNTYTTLPAYNLLSSPFKNWRGMELSGGRRMKRSILIDLDTVKFATDEQLKRWMSIDLLRDYLNTKMGEMQAYNQQHPSAEVSVANSRKLTNIGTFRAYCVAYLKSKPSINKSMTLLVRQGQPTREGLPLEIYCFTHTTNWVPHEAIQSDIFDHLLSIMPEFGLSCFQVSSTNAVRDMLKKA